jgi:hypothetical protein
MGLPGLAVCTIDPLLRPGYTMLSHVLEHLKLKQRGAGPRSGPKTEMESARVAVPRSECLFPVGETRIRPSGRQNCPRKGAVDAGSNRQVQT